MIIVLPLHPCKLITVLFLTGRKIKKNNEYLVHLVNLYDLLPTSTRCWLATVGMVQFLPCVVRPCDGVQAPGRSMSQCTPIR